MAPRKKKPEKKEEEGEKKILVPVRVLEGLADRIERLEGSADTARLYHFDAKHAKKGPNVVRLSVYEDDKGKTKIVTAWRTLKDSVRKMGNVGVVEDQQYEVLFHDGSKKDLVGYVAFSEIRYTKQIRAEEVSRTTDAEGASTLKVRLRAEDAETIGLEDREFSIDLRFVN